MNRPDLTAVSKQAHAAAEALNSVLDACHIDRLDIRFIPSERGGLLAEIDGWSRRCAHSAIYNLPDGMGRTFALSAWAVFGEVLAQIGRGDMVNISAVTACTLALTDHAHLIRGVHAAQVVETTMREGLQQQATPRRHGKRRR
jgi:hypothetical protein